MKDLAERIMGLTGPDREIDAEIVFDLFAKPVGKRSDGGPVGYLWPEDNPSWSLGIRFPNRTREYILKNREALEETLLIERDGGIVLMNDLRVKPYTATVDAALTLARSEEEAQEAICWAVQEMKKHGVTDFRAVLACYITARLLMVRN